VRGGDPIDRIVEEGLALPVELAKEHRCQKATR
jgi:hypothetical protein